MRSARDVGEDKEEIIIWMKNEGEEKNTTVDWFVGFSAFRQKMEGEVLYDPKERDKERIRTT